MFKRILVAVDGSENAGRAVDLAIELAQRFDAELIALSVYKHRTYMESSLSLVRTREVPAPPDEVMHGLAKEAVEWAAERARAAGLAKGRIKTLIRRGPPARTIVKTAKRYKVDAIVLGTRGLGDVEGFFQGSVSHKVNALADRTCITVR
ncbi:MAG: universal stress protein [Halofilum sp. (in: g-proteobacteria)]|nr:universal stress protein [Halofilum sp. (in: g-proteobacteria)]